MSDTPKYYLFVSFSCCMLTFILITVLFTDRITPITLYSNKVNQHELHNRYLIIGLAHSSTTYLQQFIGEVLLNKSDTLMLFEPIHRWRNIELYNSFGKHHIGFIQTSMLIDFYQCNFDNMLKPFRQSRIFNAYMNNIYHFPNNTIDYTLVRDDQWVHDQYYKLINQCKMRKNLLFKVVTYDMDSYSMLSLLWKHYPNLKIFHIVRDPFTHIPSFTQFSNHQNPPDFNKIITQICYQTYDSIQYAKQMEWNKNASNYQIINSDIFWTLIQQLKNKKTKNKKKNKTKTKNKK
eukprot:161679_1